MIDWKSVRKEVFLEVLDFVDAYKARALEVAEIYNRVQCLWTGDYGYSPDPDTIVFRPSEGRVNMTYYDGYEDTGLDILLDDLWEEDVAIHSRLLKEKKEKEAAKKALKDKENEGWKAGQVASSIRFLKSIGYEVTKKDVQ